MQTLSKEIPTLTLQMEDEREEGEEENDENILDNENSQLVQRKASKQSEIGNDGLDKFLEDCFRAEEDQMQLDREYVKFIKNCENIF